MFEPIIQQARPGKCLILGLPAFSLPRHRNEVVVIVFYQFDGDPSVVVTPMAMPGGS